MDLLLLLLLLLLAGPTACSWPRVCSAVACPPAVPCPAAHPHCYAPGSSAACALPVWDPSLQAAGTPAEVVAACDITLAMLSDPTACLEVATGGQGAERRVGGREGLPVCSRMRQAQCGQLLVSNCAAGGKRQQEYLAALGGCWLRDWRCRRGAGGAPSSAWLQARISSVEGAVGCLRGFPAEQVLPSAITTATGVLRRHSCSC